MSLVLIIRVIADLVVIISLPLHILLFVVIKRNRKHAELGSSFYFLVMNNCVICIAQSLLKLLFEETADVPEFADLFAKNANIVGKLQSARTYFLGFVAFTNTATIAVNRMVAVLFFQKYNKMRNSNWNLRATVVGWCIWLIIFFPQLYPLQFEAVCFENEYVYQLVNKSYITPYLVVSILVGSVGMIVTYACYAVIGVRLLGKGSTSNSTRQSVKKTTLAAIVSSFGNLLTVLVVTLQQVAWMIWKIDLFPVDMYYALFRLGVDYSLVSMPWVLIVLSSVIRQKMLGIKSPNSSNVATIVVRNKTTSARQ